MFLLLLHAVPSPLEDAIARFAQLAGLSLYEARTRLQGPVPRVASGFADRGQAEALAGALAAQGFATSVLDAAAVEHDGERDMVSSLALGPAGFDATLRSGETRSVRYDALSLLLQGARTSSVTVTEDEKVRKFSAGRALLTGGLVMSKSTTRTTTQATEVREVFLYAYEAGARPSLALYERRLHYGFLGSALQASSAANFATVLAELRRRAPHARFDASLLKPASLGALPLPPPGRAAAEWKSDVAAALASLTA